MFSRTYHGAGCSPRCIMASLPAHAKRHSARTIPAQPPLNSPAKTLQTALTAALLSTALLVQPLLLTTPVALANEYTITSRGSVGEEALFENIPGSLSSGADEAPREALGPLLAGKNGEAVANCAKKCVTTCVRGGEGAPGLGPLSLRGELVVFKDGYRSRQYCLSECTQVCSKLVQSNAAAQDAKKGR